MSSTWEKLAAGEDLPAAVCGDVWRSGDSKARKKLAAARNLPRDIEETIASGADREILEAWLTQKRDVRLLEAVDTDLSREIRVSMSRQPHLTEAIRRRIASRREEKVLESLLGRVDLSILEHDDYLAEYVCSRELRRDTYGATLLGLIGDHETTWLKLLDRIGPRQSGLLADAAYMTERESTQRLAQSTLLRIADRAPEQELIRAARGLISGRWLTPAEYLELAGHQKLASVAVELRRRATLDTPTIMRNLTHCAGGTAACTNQQHESDLASLLSWTGTLRMSWKLPVQALMRHRAGVEERDRLAFTKLLTRIEAGELVEELLRRDDHDGAAEIIDAAPVAPVKVTGAVRGALARRGSAHAVEGELTEEEVEIVLDHYQPAAGLLENPVLGGRVAHLVAGRCTEERELIYKLLPEWSGNLQTLFDAAKTL